MNEDSSKARGFIAGVIAIGIVSLAGGLFLTTPSHESVVILTGLLSALTLALGAVVQYYFGSSSGTRVLADSQNETVKTLAAAVATSSPASQQPLNNITPTGTPDDPVSTHEVPAADATKVDATKADATKVDKSPAWAATATADDIDSRRSALENELAVINTIRPRT